MKLAIDDNVRYVVTLHPSIALDYILNLIHNGYSIHAHENTTGTAIVITVKAKREQTINISNKAKKMLETVMYTY